MVTRKIKRPSLRV